MSASNQPPVGLIGVGLLGLAIARRLLGQGRVVVGHDLEEQALQRLREAGGTPVDGVVAAAKHDGPVILCLPHSEAVNQVAHELLALLEPQRLIVDTTTGDPQQTRQQAQRAAEHQIHWVDAAVLGSSQRMETGQAVLLVGGDTDAVTQAQPLLDQLSCQVQLLGASGSGQQMKLVANLVLGLNRAALAEGLHLAEQFGIDLGCALEALKSGAAYSTAMDAKGEKMIQSNYAPQARLSQHLKDVRLILVSGEAHEAWLPLSQQHRRMLEHAEQCQLGPLDNSAIFEALRQHPLLPDDGDG